MTLTINTMYSLTLRCTGSEPMLFPDDDSAILYVTKNTPEQEIIDTITGLFKSLRKLVIEDYNDYMSSNPELSHKGVKNVLSIFKPVKYPDVKNIQIPKYKHKVGDTDMENTKGSKYIIQSSYKKNALVTDFHSEEFQCSISKCVESDLNENQLLGEQVYLNAIAEKATILAMNVDGLISDAVKNQKLALIDAKLGLAKSLK